MRVSIQQSTNPAQPAVHHMASVLQNLDLQRQLAHSRQDSSNATRHAASLEAACTRLQQECQQIRHENEALLAEQDTSQDQVRRWLGSAACKVEQDLVYLGLTTT